MIYTFYSYKGGVGRSTALANVARCLYLQGLKVLIVDWNLQSPGLESFFFEQVDAAPVEGAETGASRGIAWAEVQLGVIEMLVDYQQSFGWIPRAAQPAEETAEVSEREDTPVPSSVETAFERRVEEPVGEPHDRQQEFAPRERMPLSEYLVPIHLDDRLENPSRHGGSLYLLTAGRRSREHFESYAQTVADFSLDKLDAGFRGKEYFDSLRRELLQAADVVLIDGPTGVSEVGGVCTDRLADVVVCFCAPSDQNVEGTARMLEHFTSARTLAAREHRPLTTIVVPARVDHSEPEAAREFERRFARLIEKSPLPAPLQARGFRQWDLQIPYRPELAFREQCVVGRDGSGAATTDRPEAAYVTLAFQLAELAPEGHPIRRQLAGRSHEASPALVTNVEAHVPQPVEQVETSGSELFAELSTTPPPSTDPFWPPTSAAQSAELDELKAALLEAAEIGDFTVESSATGEAALSTAPGDAGARSTTSVPDRIVERTVEEPKDVLPPRSPLSEPSVPPVAAHHVAARRLPARWGWPSAGLSFLILGTILYFGVRGRGDTRPFPDQTGQATPTHAAEERALGVAPPSTHEEAKNAPADRGTGEITGAAAPEQPSTPALYLRVGLGPSCPRMLNYRKQFRAAGMADAQVAALKSGGCALVLGPYPAELVEGRRKEHNARHIRGFDSANVVDDRDFDKLL